MGGSALVYLPLALAFGELEWTTFGPFTFQTSRVLHYALYFGVVAGAYGIERGLLAAGGPLAQRWRRWVLGALGAFVLLLVTVVAAVATGAGGGARTPPAVAATAGGTALVLPCAASSLALLAVFLRFANGHRRLPDTLRDNAYGIFVLQYPVVSWLQYARLPAPLPGIVKGALVFLASLAVSWGAVALLRRLAASWGRKAPA